MSEVASHGADTPTSSIGGTEGSQVDRPAPVFLPLGAAVSAKYRGAFCEALIERVDVNFRLRVQRKDGKGAVSIDKTGYVSGRIEPSGEVMVKISGDNAPKAPVAATIIRISDLSLYTVGKVIALTSYLIELSV